MALAVLLAGLCSACAPSRPFIATSGEEEHEVAPPSLSKEVYRVFLIGDAGAAMPDEPALRLLKARLAETGQDGAVVFLGDNVYPSGLPDSASAERPEAEARLMAQLKTVKDFPGRVVFIPGNHDWDRGREALARQEAFVEQYLDRGNTFLPDDGFPGPAEVELTNEITLLALDTEWWLAERPTFGDAGAYDLDEPADVLLELEGLLYEHRNEHVLVVGHHPLFSNGRHGGHFSLKEHLTPLPLVGSALPLYRRFIGKRQDLASARYRLFRRELLRIFGGQERLVYAAGHDHNLQHFRQGDRWGAQHYLVSGAGSRVSHVAGGHGAAFTAEASGFVALRYYADGQVWMEAWTPEGDGTAGRLLYRQRLMEPVPDFDEDASPPGAPERYPDYRDSTVVRAINPDYAKVRGLGATLLGRRYRDLWATPVEVPVLDLARDAGGLVPLRLGGGAQTISLRMQAKGGKVYNLRSIDKVAGSAWAPELRRTLAGEVLQDQTSMHHPFGALIVPPLADAVGVFHTNPRLVYVPDDPRLGAAREALSGEVVLFEERPDEDMSDVRSMGYAENVIGTAKLFQEIGGDNDHRVGARAFARARLFDMLLADWDRHGDQWRWAAFEPYELDSTLTDEARKEGKVYLPVPRDRDMAFLQVDGLVPALYALLADPLRQDFDDTYGYVRGLNRKGLPLDRRFTASLTREDWIEIADSIRAALTGEAIEAAVRALPEPVFEQSGAEMIRRLKVRRDKLPRVAEKYYGVLARVVDVVGSGKHERFEVTRLPGGETDVVVYKTSKEGEVRKEIYRRTFYPSETEEIRLYGLGGRDRFIVEGDVRGGIRVRAIGGAGEDAFVDASDVRGWGKKTYVYDTRAGTEIEAGPETDVRLSGDPAVNRYELRGYRYDTVEPVAFFGSNPDDGLFIGGGAKFTRHGFRKAPHAATHRMEGNFAAATRAFNLRYRGHYVGVLGPWSLGLEAAVYSPNHIRNFYGLGNETESGGRDARFYQARLSRALVKPLLARSLGPGVTLRVGPTFEYTDVREDEGRFASQPQAGVSPNTFGRLLFGGAEAELEVKAIDDAVNPRQGFRFRSEVDLNAGLVESEDTYATLASSLTLYYSPSLSPQVTVAARAGAAHNVGAFPFFAAGTLGGSRNLRGYRSTRFAGRTSLYQNLDVRVGLLNFAGYLGYGRLGVLGFLDNGRVWTDGEASRVWHQGYGGGLWAHLFEAATLTGTVGFSEEDRTLTIELGFLF